MPSETHTLIVGRDGVVTLPDLTGDLLPLAAALGRPPPEPLPSRLGGPRLERARQVHLPLAAPLETLAEPVLWRWHARGAAAYRRGAAGGGVPWLEIKLELARRLLGPRCRLCALGCPVDRTAGERGRCGLGADWPVTQAVPLWGEEEELGRPGLGLFSAGCGLRCRFCYKPENLRANDGSGATGVDSPLTSADGATGGLSASAVLQLVGGTGGQAASGIEGRPLGPMSTPTRSGASGTEGRPLGPMSTPTRSGACSLRRGAATHLHFLGGNPDESLPGILAWLIDHPPEVSIVWNTHAYLTAAQVALLEGLVDAVIADLKFGPGECDRLLAGIRGYWPAATRALLSLARMDLRLIVRHVAVPGHLACCAAPAAAWARAHLPRARVRVLDQYQPLWRAARERGLDEEERAAVANLGDDPPMKGLPT